jgi:hypothetical protein
MRPRPSVAASLTAGLLLLAPAVRAQSSLPARESAPTTLVRASTVPASRSVTVDYHMARARDFRAARRWDAAIAALDSVVAADPRAPGAHPMRALVLAERGDAAGSLVAIRAARAAGDTLAYATALQVGGDRYRLGMASRHEPDLLAALVALQLADSLAPTRERRGVARLLVAATALSLANRRLATSGAPATCANVAVALGHLDVALESVTSVEVAPEAQLALVRSALDQLAAYTDAESRRLRCA